jgi:16S rRNA (cytosine1402-N4)-methyltransferase
MTPPPHHVPVMLAEIVELLAPALAGNEPVLVDATLGLGGHAEALLRACPEAHLVGLDRDPQALALAGERLAPFGERVTLVEAVYDELPEVLARLGRPRVQGVLLDLGLSSLQIDDPERGFAYAYDAPLDMRMGQQELTAAQVLNTYARADLARVLRNYGEERFADRIAGRIVAERTREPFVTSARLVRLLDDAVPARSQRTGGHPAKRTFQALRIEVNGELAALESVLPDAIAALAVGGRIAVLAYHSLEDRLVKQLLAAGARDRAPRDLPVVPPELAPELRLLTRGAQRPTADEVAANPRAASARLRAAERISERRAA